MPWRIEWHTLQHSCLEDPMDRGAWQAMFHRVANSQTWLKQLSTRACTCEHPVERSFDLPLCIFFYIFTSIYFQHLEQCLAYSISYRQIHIHQTKLQNTFPKINSASLWMVDLGWCLLLSHLNILILW